MKLHRVLVTTGAFACLVVGAAVLAAAPSDPSASAPAPAMQSSGATTKPGTTITQSDGLKITYDSPGSPAKDGDTVSVLYTGKLENGTVFDASDKHGNEPIEFILGKGMVIKGWDQGLLGMQVGEKRTLVIPPELGYGEQGAGGGVIPPHATLTFEVELVGLKRTVAK